MIRESAILWAVAVCLTCPAAEWSLHDVIRLQEEELALSDAQKQTLLTIEDAYMCAIDALDKSRKTMEEAIAGARIANAAAINDVLTQDQQATLGDMFREFRESESQEQLARDVEHLAQLLPTLKKLKAIKSVTVLEGLERKGMDLPKPPPNGPPMVQVGTHFFFEQPLELDEDVQLAIKETVGNYRYFGAYAGGKFCGGFHPDANIRIDTDHGMIQMLVCFGCAEIRIVDGAGELMVEIEKEAYWALEAICRRSFRHRKAGVIPAALSVIKKAEPSVGADSP
jgi:hypothetical protein